MNNWQEVSKETPRTAAPLTATFKKKNVVVAKLIESNPDVKAFHQAYFEIPDLERRIVRDQKQLLTQTSVKQREVMRGEQKSIYNAVTDLQMQVLVWNHIESPGKCCLNGRYVLKTEIQHPNPIWLNLNSGCAITIEREAHYSKSSGQHQQRPNTPNSTREGISFQYRFLGPRKDILGVDWDKHLPKEVQREIQAQGGTTNFIDLFKGTYHFVEATGVYAKNSQRYVLRPFSKNTTSFIDGGSSTISTPQQEEEQKMVMKSLRNKNNKIRDFNWRIEICPSDTSSVDSRALNHNSSAGNDDDSGQSNNNGYIEHSSKTILEQTIGKDGSRHSVIFEETIKGHNEKGLKAQPSTAEPSPRTAQPSPRTAGESKMEPIIERKKLFEYKGWIVTVRDTIPVCYSDQIYMDEVKINEYNKNLLGFYLTQIQVCGWTCPELKIRSGLTELSFYHPERPLLQGAGTHAGNLLQNGMGASLIQNANTIITDSSSVQNTSSSGTTDSSSIQNTSSSGTTASSNTVSVSSTGGAGSSGGVTTGSASATSFTGGATALDLVTREHTLVSKVDHDLVVGKDRFLAPQTITARLNNIPHLCTFYMARAIRKRIHKQKHLRKNRVAYAKFLIAKYRVLTMNNYFRYNKRDLNGPAPAIVAHPFTNWSSVSDARITRQRELNLLTGIEDMVSPSLPIHLGSSASSSSSKIGSTNPTPCKSTRTATAREEFFQKVQSMIEQTTDSINQRNAYDANAEMEKQNDLLLWGTQQEQDALHTSRWRRKKREMFGPILYDKAALYPHGTAGTSGSGLFTSIANPTLQAAMNAAGGLAESGVNNNTLGVSPASGLASGLVVAASNLSQEKARIAGIPRENMSVPELKTQLADEDNTEYIAYMYDQVKAPEGLGNIAIQRVRVRAQAYPPVQPNTAQSVQYYLQGDDFRNFKMYHPDISKLPGGASTTGASKTSDVASSKTPSKATSGLPEESQKPTTTITINTELQRAFGSELSSLHSRPHPAVLLERGEKELRSKLFGRVDDSGVSKEKGDKLKLQPLKINPAANFVKLHPTDKFRINYIPPRLDQMYVVCSKEKALLVRKEENTNSEKVCKLELGEIVKIVALPTSNPNRVGVKRLAFPIVLDLDSWEHERVKSGLAKKKHDRLYHGDEMQLVHRYKEFRRAVKVGEMRMEQANLMHAARREEPAGGEGFSPRQPEKTGASAGNNRKGSDEAAMQKASDDAKDNDDTQDKDAKRRRLEESHTGASRQNSGRSGTDKGSSASGLDNTNHFQNSDLDLNGDVLENGSHNGDEDDGDDEDGSDDDEDRLFADLDAEFGFSDSDFGADPLAKDDTSKQTPDDSPEGSPDDDDKILPPTAPKSGTRNVTDPFATASHNGEKTISADDKKAFPDKKGSDKKSSNQFKLSDCYFPPPFEHRLHDPATNTLYALNTYYVEQTRAKQMESQSARKFAEAAATGGSAEKDGWVSWRGPNQAPLLRRLSLPDYLPQSTWLQKPLNVKLYVAEDGVVELHGSKQGSLISGVGVQCYWQMYHGLYDGVSEIRWLDMMPSNHIEWRRPRGHTTKMRQLLLEKHERKKLQQDSNTLSGSAGAQTGSALNTPSYSGNLGDKGGGLLLNGSVLSSRLDESGKTRTVTEEEDFLVGKWQVEWVTPTARASILETTGELRTSQSQIGNPVGLRSSLSSSVSYPADRLNSVLSRTKIEFLVDVDPEGKVTKQGMPYGEKIEKSNENGIIRGHYLGILSSDKSSIKWVRYSIWKRIQGNEQK